MQQARHHLLAAAGLAVEQDVDRRRGDVADHQLQFLDGRRAADQVGHVGVLGARGAQLAVLQHQVAPLLGAPHGVEQAFGGEGFFDEVVGAAAHRRHRHVDVAVAGDDDHRQLGVERGGVGQQLQAGAAGQAHVGDDDAGEVGAQQGQRLLGAGAGTHREAAQLQRLRGGQAQRRFVFNQDGLQR